LLEPEDCAVVGIDLQPGFYGNGPDVGGRLAAAFTGAAQLVGLAGVLSVPVVLTEEDPELNGSTASVILENLPSTATVVTKPVFDLSADEAIYDVVARSGRQQMVIMGMETDVCVLQSAIGLMQRGFGVAAVIDCLYSPGVGHQQGLDRLQANGVEMISTKGVFYDWVRTPQEARRLRDLHPKLAPPAPHDQTE
jgi:nicotinamidase-related amidase